MTKHIFKTLDSLCGNYSFDRFKAISSYNIDWYAFMAYVGQYEISKSMFPDAPVEDRYQMLMEVVQESQPEIEKLQAEEAKASGGCCGGGEVK